MAADRDDETWAEWSGIPLHPDDVFAALGNSRRRIAILSLSRANGAIPVGDLAVEIAAREAGVGPSEVQSEDRTSVYVGLTQNHLPILHDLGVVQYDDRSKQVSPATATDALAQIIRAVQSACYNPEGEE